jgi:hypothetical protein
VEQSHSIVALTLVVLGGSGLVYFYFIDPTWPRWIVIAARRSPTSNSEALFSAG